MDFLEQLTTQKESELEAYLSRLDDPHLRQLLADLAALKRTREIAADLMLPAAVRVVEQNGNGNGTAPSGLTQGDAVVEMLRKAGHALHINDIITKLREQYGFQNVKKPNLNSILRKDRRNRFVSTGGGHFALREDTKAIVDHKRVPHGGVSPLTQMGFSLIEAVAKLVSTIEDEFSQPMIHDKLVELYPPDIARHIQKASVSTTLRKLAERGLIFETFAGLGGDPKRYRRVKSADSSLFP